MKQCKQGYYYCNTDKKCKRIPLGYRVASSGYLRKENGDDQTDSDNDNGETTNGDGGGMSEGSLFKWFQGSKSKSKKGKKGKPGWVNVLTGGTCASDEPGEGVPKCVSRSKYDSMTKAERKSAARRKKTADSGQQEKSGAAKPTYVPTDKPEKKMKKEEVEIIEAKDKKGKGSGSKDACYKKVKSRYSVWPSAYASGALVKCRKVGAANWGNKSESVEYSDWRNDFQATEYEFVDIIKPEPIKGGQEQIDELKCWKGYKRKKGSIPGEKGSCVKAHVELEGEKIEEEKEESKIDGGNLKKLAAKAVKRVDADVDGDVDTDDMKSSETGEFVPSPDGKKLKPKVRFEGASDWRNELGEAIDKSKMKCNSPKSQAVGDSQTGKSHVVKACEGGKEKIIRFGQRGVKGSPKKEGESKEYASRRNRFKTRHAKNISKGKMSAAYWSNKVKW